MLRLLKLIKLLKYAKSTTIHDAIYDRLPISDVLWKVARLVIFIVFAGHYTACFWCTPTTLFVKPSSTAAPKHPRTRACGRSSGCYQLARHDHATRIDHPAGAGTSAPPS
jgi:hypothetical protein